MTGIVINLPYTAQSAPAPVLKRLDLNAESWRLEHWRLIDPPLAEVVARAAIFEKKTKRVERPVIIYPFSPLVADPWGLWAAELNGEEAGAARQAPAPGFIARTTEGRPINFSPKDRDVIFSRAVAPFHQQLEQTARELMEKSPLVLILTIRSFTSRPLSFEKDKKYPRPQAAVGATAAVTPPGLSHMAGEAFHSLRWWVELNRPQGGAFVPPGLRGHPRVRALGLSLCRGLYMDERSGRKKSSAKSAARVLATALNLLDQELERVAALRLDRAGRPGASSASKTPSPVIKAGR
ncbi:MAG: N-formylglutamate amidohydrolase [Candidatus Adiutrix sp.]|jgi:hypothetical protein|nr:N-formylglutamate amidohydrolase [Candidatus Adiutrix sp.]